MSQQQQQVIIECMDCDCGVWRCYLSKANIILQAGCMSYSAEGGLHVKQHDPHN